MRPYGGWVALAAVIGGASALAASADPLFYRYLLDLVVRAASGHTGAAAVLRPAILATAGLLAVNLGQQALQAGLSLTTNKVRFDASFAFARRSLAEILRQPLSRHLATGDDHGVGATMTRIDRGVMALGQLIGDVLQSLLPNLANLAIIAALLFRLAPRLGWVALAPLPLFLWVSWRATAEGVAAEEEVQEGWRRLYRRVHEVLAAIKTLQSLGGETAELARYERGAGAIFARLWRLMRRDVGYGGARGLLSAAGRAAVLLYGADLVLAHRLTPGTWIAAVSYAGMIYGPLAGLSGLYTSLSTHLVTAGAALELCEAAAPAGHASPGPPLGGAIEFQNVSFAYTTPDGESTTVLRDASFRIAPGEIVALTGPSGGGKTTIADLLMKFYEPTRGRILVDGRDLAGVPASWLREQIAVVLQDAILFEGTVTENIAFAAAEPDADAVRAAAQAAQADEFILRLPEGYRTHIGERGARLSGGQRQRLAIARALYRNAPIVIFDEASSNLDGASEAALNAALAPLMAGRTGLLIAHHEAALALADRVLCVADGVVSDSGAAPGAVIAPAAQAEA